MSQEKVKTYTAGQAHINCHKNEIQRNFLELTVGQFTGSLFILGRHLRQRKAGMAASMDSVGERYPFT